MPAPSVDRDTLMAYRVLACGLDRSAAEPADLGVLALGLQDRDGSAAVALANRLREPAANHPEPPVRGNPRTELIGAPADDTPLVVAWTLRGSPHVHPRGDLPRIAAAVRPTSESDAMAMLVGSGKALAAAGVAALDALDVVTAMMREVATGPVAKAELSTALTAALPGRYVSFCAGCGVDHVPEQLFRCAALPAGLGLVPGVRATLAPLSPALAAPTTATGRDRLVATYLDLYGAATKAEVAAHLATTAGALEWPDTVPVVVDGERLQTTPDRLAAITGTDPSAVRDIVRLLPPGDPLLQPRTRSLIVPDRSRWKALWPALGPAGALLAGGRIAGTWRPKVTGRHLRLTVDVFGPLTRFERAALQTEADVIGRVRGLNTVTVDVS